MKNENILSLKTFVRSIIHFFFLLVDSSRSALHFFSFSLTFFLHQERYRFPTEDSVINDLGNCCELVAASFVLVVAWLTSGFEGWEGGLCSPQNLQKWILKSFSSGV